MKKYLILLFCCFLQFRSQAQILEIIKEAVTKVIKAVDLKIQRLQTKTIWLQNAQKEIENVMSKLRLDEITDWVQKQKELYAEYYQELQDVKAVISGFDQARTIVQLQAKLVAEYQRAYGLFRGDKHFSRDELAQMFQVYTGILGQSVQHLDAALLVLAPAKTTMRDGERLSLIQTAYRDLRKNYDDLRQFNNQNALLSLQRARDTEDAATIKRLYGLP